MKVEHVTVEPMPTGDLFSQAFVCHQRSLGTPCNGRGYVEFVKGIKLEKGDVVPNGKLKEAIGDNQDLGETIGNSQALVKGIDLRQWDKMWAKKFTQEKVAGDVSFRRDKHIKGGRCHFASQREYLRFTPHRVLAARVHEDLSERGFGLCDPERKPIEVLAEAPNSVTVLVNINPNWNHFIMNSHPEKSQG